MRISHTCNVDCAEGNHTSLPEECFVLGWCHLVSALQEAEHEGGGTGGRGITDSSEYLKRENWLQRVSAEPSMGSHRKEYQAFVTSHSQRPQRPDYNCSSLGRPLLTLPVLPLSSRSPSQQPSKEHHQLVGKEKEKKRTSIPIPPVYKL